MVEKYKEVGATVLTEFPKFDVDPIYISKLRKYLKREQIDVIHTHDLKGGVNAHIAGALAGVKVRVGHVHTPISQWQISKFKKIINILVYAFVGNFLIEKEIALSQDGKHQKVSTGILSGKIAVIPNYVETPQNPNNERKQEFIKKWGFEDSFILGCLGRISAEKGQELLIKAFYKISQEFPQARLALIGGGPLQQECQILINELKLNEKVVITGIFNDEDKATLFSTLQLFVFPSRAEGFGYVPLEALSLNIPVISSDLPVLKEVLGERVQYFQNENVEDLTREIRESINNYQILKNNVLDSSWIGEIYGFNKFIDLYEKLYKGLM
jgi:glycosyltransferase involved in cell wall biosynthesis